MKKTTSISYQNNEKYFQSAKLCNYECDNKHLCHQTEPNSWKFYLSSSQELHNCIKEKKIILFDWNPVECSEKHQNFQFFSSLDFFDHAAMHILSNYSIHAILKSKIFHVSLRPFFFQLFSRLLWSNWRQSRIDFAWETLKFIDETFHGKSNHNEDRRLQYK